MYCPCQWKSPGQSMAPVWTVFWLKEQQTASSELLHCVCEQFGTKVVNVIIIPDICPCPCGSWVGWHGPAVGEGTT